MRRVERDGIPLLAFDVLDAVGLTCFVSTVALDIRRPEDRDRFVAAAGLDPRRTVGVRQVHKSDIVRADAPLAGDPPAADGLVTAEPGLALLVRAADCSLVVAADPTRRAVGVVHAGWKGSARGAVVNLVKALHEHYGSRPRDLVAAVGPTIGQENYEVGGEVPAAFLRSRAWTAEYVAHRAGKLYFDLPGANARFLRECGVREASIEVCDLCTFANPELFHSFRRDGTGGGHHGLVAAWA